MLLMDIVENVSLKNYSTMRLGGDTKHLIEIKNEAELKQATNWALNKNLPIIIIGEGSNIVWRDEGFEGLIIVNRIGGIEKINEEDNSVTVKAGAGEIWDKLVEWSVKRDLSGIEFLSRIPGTAGAAPVQNIGAYGAELSNVLTELEAFDSQSGNFVKLRNTDCAFSYRNSRFKSSDKRRFFITSITLKLNKTKSEPPFYESLQKYLDEHSIKEFTPKNIRQAVTEIRKIKLPDPSVVANNGSFFTNPIIDEQDFKKLRQKYPTIKGWPRDGRVKIAAGWLVEQAGFKDFHDKETGMGTWWGSALVMINENAKSTADLLAFKQKIIAKVHDMFGIVLEQEPELLP